MTEERKAELKAFRKETYKDHLKHGDMKMLADTIGCSIISLINWFNGSFEETKIDYEPYVLKLVELRKLQKQQRLAELEKSVKAEKKKPIVSRYYRSSK